MKSGSINSLDGVIFFHSKYSGVKLWVPVFLQLLHPPTDVVMLSNSSAHAYLEFYLMPQKMYFMERTQNSKYPCREVIQCRPQ